MNCDVCIGGGDFDGYPEFFETSWPKAKKQHVCGECRGQIQPGETYEAASGKFDGHFFYEKTCEACADIRQVYSCGETPPAFGYLWNDFHESGAFEHLRMAGECWDSLSAPGKEKLLDKWRKWKGLR